MAANPLTVVSNDLRAKRVTGMPRHEMQEAMAGAATDAKDFEDEKGFVCAFGRGTTDPLITYLSLARDNMQIYIYVNGVKNGLVVSTVKP